MEEEREVNQTPKCPYCHDSGGDCKHVLLDYDASFMDYLSGYLTNHNEEIDEFEISIYELVQSSKKPALENEYLELIWQYALDNFDPESEKADLDTTSYFNLFYDIIDDHGGMAFHYEDEDGMPGYYSAYIIYFAENPQETLWRVNKYMIEQLKGQ